jgi:hypothetical protein
MPSFRIFGPIRPISGGRTHTGDTPLCQTVEDTAGCSSDSSGTPEITLKSHISLSSVQSSACEINVVSRYEMSAY